MSAPAWIDRAEATLAANGRKRGGARRAVLELLDGQTCALTAVQIGLLDPDNLPVAGVAEARKMVDKTLPSNALMPNWARSERPECIARTFSKTRRKSACGARHMVR